MEPISKMIDKIDWKSTKGIVLIVVIALLIIGTIILTLADGDKFIALLYFLVIIVAILFFLAPRQTIIIGEEAEIDGGVEQEMKGEKLGPQYIEAKDKSKIKKDVTQK
jgi:uncharacterized membrane protein YfcA